MLTLQISRVTQQDFVSVNVFKRAGNRPVWRGDLARGVAPKKGIQHSGFAV
jgi:hypothetical protein